LPAWLGTHVITAGRTQTGEDKIAIVINLATRVQKAFFDEMCNTIFNLIRRITCELDGPGWAMAISIDSASSLNVTGFRSRIRSS
jgi:hypothetical protein